MNKNEKILKSFPPNLEKDVQAVLNILKIKEEDINSPKNVVIIKGTSIMIPERIYFNEPIYVNLTTVQKYILDCIFTRHHNGFIRQHHLQNLLCCKEYWAIPFCFKLLGEYVKEILYDVKTHIENNFENYLCFIGENKDFFNKTKSRMISYWNCYYRKTFPKYESYIGSQIFNNLEAAYNKRVNLPKSVIRRTLT